MRLDEGRLKAYRAGRVTADPALLCHAPFTSINFEQNGNMTVCCFNRSHVLGRYPEDTVISAWTGEAAASLRNAIFQDDLGGGCLTCARFLQAGNFEGMRAPYYDQYAYEHSQEVFAGKKIPPPKVLEFEIANTCNLECIMCGGDWSSAIRKNREGLPAIKSPYDKNFAREVSAFIPDLEHAHFLGGEPFLISLYYEIWEDIILQKPGLEVAITTNGTVLNKRAQDIISRLDNCMISVSVDSLNKETYEYIRRPAVFEEFYSNLEYLMGTGKLVSLSVCPMIQNRMEIPDIIRFCEVNDLNLFLNVVREPLGGRLKGIHEMPGREAGAEMLPETSMKYLSADELAATIAYYRSLSFSPFYAKKMDSLIAQLNDWLEPGNLSSGKHAHKADIDTLRLTLFSRLEKMPEWRNIRSRILEVEEFVRKNNGDLMAFYSRLLQVPVETLARYCLEMDAGQLFEAYTWNE